MAMKKITLAFSLGQIDGGKDHGKSVEQWRVVKVVNTINPAPGKYLDKDEVESMCRSQGWVVTIIEEKQKD